MCCTENHGSWTHVDDLCARLRYSTIIIWPLWRFPIQLLCIDLGLTVNTLRPRQDGRYFADDVLKCIFLNENVWISLKIPLKFVPRGPINNIPALVQIMAWRWPGEKPLSEPMLVFVPTHICVTRPQWVNARDATPLLTHWSYVSFALSHRDNLVNFSIIDVDALAYH